MRNATGALFSGRQSTGKPVAPDLVTRFVRQNPSGGGYFSAGLLHADRSQMLRQGLLPGGHGRSAGQGVILARVQHAVRRSGRGRAVLGHRDRFQRDGKARLAENLRGEVVPGGRSRVDHVIQTKGPALQQEADRTGEVRDVGRRAVLIGHHAELLSLASKPEHGRHEVAGRAGRRGAVQSAGANDEMLRPPGGESLPFELTPRIDALRGGLVALAIGRPAGRIAAENLVGADLDQRAVQLAADRRQVPNAPGVDRPAEIGLLLRPVDLGIGCRVDQGVRPEIRNGRPYALPIRQVQRRQVQPQSTVAKLPAELAAQLTFRTSDGNPQGVGPVRWGYSSRSA